jgi:hypothetical protein
MALGLCFSSVLGIQEGYGSFCHVTPLKLGATLSLASVVAQTPQSRHSKQKCFPSLGDIGVLHPCEETAVYGFTLAVLPIT